MEDQMIIDLFWRRSEDAVAEVQSRYGGMCMKVAGNILKDPEDIRECLNDTYLALWNRIPPERPNILSAFIKRIVRNLALKRSEYNHAAKRCSEADVSLDELEGTLCAVETAESAYDAQELAGHINHFLGTLPEEQRKLFVRRYWYFDSIDQLSRSFGMSQSKVKSMLFRLRNKLRDVLLKEGYSV